MNSQTMKKYITAIVAALAFALPALASPPPEYYNTGSNTNIPDIDAVSFYNSGYFATVRGVLLGEDADNKTQVPYATHGTLYYTNAAPGLMLGQPGFLFEDLTAGGTNNARSFYNTGAILAVDTQTEPHYYIYPGGGTTAEFVPGTGLAYPSQLLVTANNIFNGLNGSMTVGQDGLLQLYGKNIAINNSVLVAGDLTGDDTNDVTSIDQDAFIEFTVGSTSSIIGQYFTAPPTFFDLWWGITNVTSNPGLLSLQALSQGVTPAQRVTARAAGVGSVALPFSGQSVTIGTNIVALNNEFATYVYSYANPVGGTNIYYNIVCVNTNFADANISAQVRFTRSFDPYFADAFAAIVFPAAYDASATEAIVQFSEPGTNKITGQPVSSSIYFLDAGAIYSNNIVMLTNTAWLGGYSRPGFFEVSTRTPAGWATAQPANDPTDAANLTNLISGGGSYATYTENNTSPLGENYTASSYGVQVGWDPETVDGVFPLTREIFGSISVDIPDPTAEPARIDIEGNKVDLTGAGIRAEGLVTLAATNLASGPTASVDWGTAIASLGATNGTLLISNIFPQSFTRLRGDIFAWSANWQLLQTNASMTNNLLFHLLVLDQSLQGSFNPTVRNLTLTGAKSIDVEDPITVINQDVFNTSNLTINSTVHFTQNASSFFGTNVPMLSILEINTNGVLSVDNVVDLGLDPTDNQISPVNRQYAIMGIGNFGQIDAATPLFQAAVFENDGGITTSNGSSMTVEAQTLDMGLVLTNQINYMLVDGNLILSAANIGVTNSYIFTGFGNVTGGGSLTLQTAPDGQITDFVPNTPTTGNVVNNFWQVNGGFSLPVKPATGDLYGTEIQTIATNGTTAQHVWAGRGDYTNAADGFVNNVVIGHLLLSWQSANSSLNFEGAGTNNGMYVDYLDFDTNSLYGDITGPGYRGGLSISSNLTIYFANCNIPVDKVMNAYPGRMVWVSNFWGPNSTILVTNEANGQVCSVSSAVVQDVDPSYPGNTPFPLNPGGVWYYGTNNECPAVTLTAENASGSAANFTKETAASLKGTYNGLFFDTNQPLPSPTNSGFFTFTLSEGGAYSGRLLMGPSSYTFSSSRSNKFDSTNAVQVIAKHGSQLLTVGLQLVNNLDGAAGVQGYVRNSNETWVAQLQGDLKPAWTAKSPSPYAGRYTLILTNGGTNNVPGGDSYATLTVSKQGVLSLAGKLADRNAFSQSVPVSQDGLWPFYAYAAEGGDFLLGWISFQSSDSGWVALQNSDATGVAIGETNIFWSKAPSVHDRYYSAGFTNTYNVAASPYVFSGKDSSIISLTNPVVVLSGGGLGLVTDPVAYNGKLKYSATNLTLNINPTLGSFTGRFQDSRNGPSLKLGGVVLQNQAGGGGFGFFLGTNNESGVVLLQNQ
ncbi:MAG: hypothetical protein ACLQU4_05265 [Limisphaerales bacterium]